MLPYYMCNVMSKHDPLYLECQKKDLGTPHFPGRELEHVALQGGSSPRCLRVIYSIKGVSSI